MKAYYQDEAVTIYHGDSLEILPELPDNSVDLVLTDPPYPSLLKWLGVGTTARMGLGREDSKSYDPDKFFKTIDYQDLPRLLVEFSRIIKGNCHTYMMSDGDTLPYIFQAIGKGWACENGCPWFAQEDLVPEFSNVKLLIWDKEVPGMGYHYRSQHEYICMLDKGKNRKLNDLGEPDVLRFKRCQGEVPTQKPPELFDLLIKQSSNTRELILDPFLGSGTTAYCAKKLNRKCIGIEIEEKYCEIAANRCSQMVMKL